MKRVAIIAVIVLTTGLTAFSLTKKENKAEVKEVTETGHVTSQSANGSLATAD
jgi:L-asparagine transporter-like permease